MTLGFTQSLAVYICQQIRENSVTVLTDSEMIAELQKLMQCAIAIDQRSRSQVL